MTRSSSVRHTGTDWRELLRRAVPGGGISIAVAVTLSGCIGDASTAVIVTNDCSKAIAVTALKSDVTPDAAAVARVGHSSVDPGETVEFGAAPGAHQEYFVVMNSDGSIAWTKEIDVPAGAPWPEVRVYGDLCPS